MWLAGKSNNPRFPEGFGGAGSRVRTRDPLITNQVLYQLSYTGALLPLTLRWGGGNGLGLRFALLGDEFFLRAVLPSRINLRARSLCEH
jgi:hypothetical protein